MEAEAGKPMMHQVNVSTECEKGRLKRQLYAVSTLGASPVPWKGKCITCGHERPFYCGGVMKFAFNCICIMANSHHFIIFISPGSHTRFQLLIYFVGLLNISVHNLRIAVLYACNLLLPYNV